MLLDIDEFTIDAFINVLFVEITAKQQNGCRISIMCHKQKADARRAFQVLCKQKKLI